MTEPTAPRRSRPTSCIRSSTADECDAGALLADLTESALAKAAESAALRTVHAEYLRDAAPHSGRRDGAPVHRGRQACSPSATVEAPLTQRL